MTDTAAPGTPATRASQRRLRAILAADLANFGGMMTVDETNTIDSLQIIRQIAAAELISHGGWLFGMPGDGVFALFESSVDALGCALRIQSRLTALPKLSALKLRIGVHIGEVVFRNETPFGESLVIAARLESLAEPGGILVSASVMDAAAAHISATFVEGGVRTLKHSPRRIETFRVFPAPRACERQPAEALLDRTAGPEPAAVKTPASVTDAAAAPAPPLAPPVEPAPPLLSQTENLADLPLQKAAVVEAREPAPSFEPETDNIDDVCLNQLIQLLTIHLGPFAKRLVRCKAMSCPQTSQLIRALALEIPTARERNLFLAQAKAVANRPH